MFFIGMVVRSKDRFKFDSNLAGRLFNTANARKNDLLDEADECDEERGSVAPEEDPDNYYKSEIEFFKALGKSNLKDCKASVDRLVAKAAADGKPFELGNSPYLCVPKPGGDGVRYFKKSAVLWFLENGVKRLSNDRTVRVTQTASFITRQQMQIVRVEKKNSRLGDWCVFSKDDIDLEKVSSNFLVGRVLSMGCLKGTKKELSRPVYECDPLSDSAKNIGALCLWYAFEERDRLITGKLIQSAVKVHGLHPVSTYLTSIPIPNFNCTTQEMTVVSDVCEQLYSIMMDSLDK